MGQDKIDLASHTTLVEQVATFILNDLKKAAPGSKILPERALAEKYDVSRKTVKNAIAILTEQGLLVRRVGKGTFVSDKVNSQRLPVVNQLIYTDDFPHGIMSKVMADINRPQELVNPSFFFGDRGVFDLYEESIQTIIDSGKKLDLIALDEGVLPILAERELLLPLDELLENSKVLSREQFHPALLDAFSHQKHLYAIPHFFTMYVLVYNKDMFRRAAVDFPDASWRWEDLTAAAEKMTVIDSETGSFKSLGLGLFYLNQNTIFSFISQNLPPEVDIAAVNVFERPETLETFQWLSEIIHTRKLCPPGQNNQLASPPTIFSAGAVAMFIATYQDYLELQNEKCPHEWGMVELPGRRRKGNSLPVQGWGICKHSTCPEQAFLVIEKLLEEQRTAEIAAAIKRIPAQWGHTNPNIPQVFRDSLRFAQASSKIIPPYVKAQKAYRNEICFFSNNLSSPEAFCRAMADNCSRKY